MLRLIFAIFLAKSIQFLTRFFNIGGGSAAPGLYALKIDPNLISKLSKQIPSQVVITGTNGKTTTSRMLAHFCKGKNLKVVHNSTGSNLQRGIASALISKSNFFGKIEGIDLGVWELDEAAFNKVVFELRPQIIVFLNAFRDQLDRYGEVDTVVNKWIKTLEKIDWNPKVEVNIGDNNTVKLMMIDKVRFLTFLFEHQHLVGEKAGKVAAKLVKADFRARIIKNRGLLGSDLKVSWPGGESEVSLPLPGIYHVVDLLAAMAVFYDLNLDPGEINEMLKDYSPAFGRFEKIKIGGKQVYSFLIKNPDGATLVLETIKPEIKKGDRLLVCLNDNFADGTDVSWVWDAEFELLVASGKSPESRVFCSGTRAWDLANRLKYAGFGEEKIVVEPNLEKALEMSLKDLEGNLFVLPTYTALIELQKIFAKKGHKKDYWREDD